ncbi:beta-lactamase/transpeptidase-like protein [Coniochaeta ligniaria NRRL 30616]|uniref:Beta-lactamase/transpeptidase-like protein n=1 Tax=Coniochaeta ligniaria NRRL 30616 TaxID=1408157 RepID=A0A1J7J808_9PEZI|nr:beta-lactamase/transpeptidase-like protein [Coniochaeta ligniaria NRRL 30616]
MRSSTITLSTTLWCLLPLSLAADTYQPCPLLRAYYDAPNLSKSSDAVNSLSKDFNAVFDNLTRTGKSDDYGAITPNTTSFSVHYTAPAAGADVNVTSDTVFALGGLTQLFTIYAWLANMGVETWSDPITKYLPELTSAACGGGTFTVDWNSVTIEALAGHMAGIARDSNVCELGAECDRQAFLSSLAKSPPIFLTNTTPLFSNAAYQLLALAMTAAQPNTTTTFPSLLNTTLLTPLNLSHTVLLTPSTSPLLFPGTDLSPSTLGEPASLSLLSTTADLAQTGRAILSSTLLPPPATRRWLSPLSADTSNVRNGVGGPWEVYRAPFVTSQLILDVLLKSGEVGAYSSYLGLVPDLGMGFAVLAHDESGQAADLNVYVDVVADGLGGIVEAAAGQGAGRYAGRYDGGKAADGGEVTAAVFGVDAWPGLVVQNMTVGGRDVRQEVAEGAGIELGGLDWRVYPTNVWDGDGRRHQFVGVVQDRGALVDAGTPTCTTWLDGVLQGVGGRVVFELDGQGKAVAVEVPGLGVSLKREGE